MGLADVALREIVDSIAFQASAAPYLLLDTELRIRAANPAYERATLQRYDVRDVATGEFVEKSWLPVNRLVHDADGRTVGVLHHVEDVTHLLAATALERSLSEPSGPVLPGQHDAFQDRVERLRQDSVVRRLKADSLVERSRQSLERLRRIAESHRGQ